MGELERLGFVKMLNDRYINYLYDGRMFEVKELGDGYSFRVFQNFCGDLVLMATKSATTLEEIIGLFFQETRKTADN